MSNKEIEDFLGAKLENYQKVILKSDKQQIRKVLFGRPNWCFLAEFSKTPVRNEGERFPLGEN